MLAKRNSPAFYDAKRMGPAAKQEGILKIGAIDDSERNAPMLAEAGQPSDVSRRSVAPGVIASLMVIGLLIGWASRRFRQKPKHRRYFSL
jgi:hypothetical protein